MVTQTCGPLHLAGCQLLRRPPESWITLFLPWTPVSLTPVGPRDHVLGSIPLCPRPQYSTQGSIVVPILGVALSLATVVQPPVNALTSLSHMS